MNLDTFQKKARIEMVPLIDVVFLLLSAFLYASLWMNYTGAVPVRLPSGKTGNEPFRGVVITITAENKISVNDVETALDNVVEMVKAATQQQSDGVLIRGDQNASLGVGVEILSLLKSAGVEKASFQVSTRHE